MYTSNPLLHPHYYFSLAQECTSKAKTPGYCNLACFGVHCSVLSERAKETTFLLQKTESEDKPRETDAPANTHPVQGADES